MIWRLHGLWFVGVTAFGLMAHGQNVGSQVQEPNQAARERLVETVLIPSGITHQRVLDSMRDAPRHELVPIRQRKDAYFDMALPIGDSQTISSPFIVAYMTEVLDPQPTDRVLEIGTGSGYQAAVLSPLVAEVYTIEIVESLGKRARADLERLGYDNVHVRVGDGFKGWPEKQPFDKIIVTCSPEEVPQPLRKQLAEGGKMVVPVGERYQQVLYEYTKRKGKLERKALRPTLFVPMTGTAEQSRKFHPDPKKPAIANGSFEGRAEGDLAIDGWYYQRQLTRAGDDDVPDGRVCGKFANRKPGLSSHAMQGFAIDGKAVAKLLVTAQIKLANVKRGPERTHAPAIVVSFYDAERVPLGNQWLGPWSGTRGWRKVSKTMEVPRRAREAILRVGLFGATGEMKVDDVSVSAVHRRLP